MDNPQTPPETITPVPRLLAFDTRTRFYYLAIVGLGLIVMWQSLTGLPLHLWHAVAIWTLLSIIVEMKPIYVTHSMVITISFAIHLSAILLWGPPVAVVTGVIGSIVTDVFHRRGVWKTIYNACQYGISIWTAGFVFYLLRQSHTGLDLAGDILAIAAASIVYMLVNTFSVAAIVALIQKRPVISACIYDLRLDVFQYFTLAPLGTIAALLYQNSPYSTLLLAIPLMMTHFSFQNYVHLMKHSQETIELLADALDKRDAYTAHHSSRVASLAVSIAQEMKLSRVGPARPDG